MIYIPGYGTRETVLYIRVTYTITRTYALLLLLLLLQYSVDCIAGSTATETKTDAACVAQYRPVRTGHVTVSPVHVWCKYKQ